MQSNLSALELKTLPGRPLRNAIYRYKPHFCESPKKAPLGHVMVPLGIASYSTRCINHDENVPGIYMTTPDPCWSISGVPDSQLRMGTGASRITTISKRMPIAATR